MHAYWPVVLSLQRVRAAIDEAVHNPELASAPTGSLEDDPTYRHVGQGWDRISCWQRYTCSHVHTL